MKIEHRDVAYITHVQRGENGPHLWECAKAIIALWGNNIWKVLCCVSFTNTWANLCNSVTQINMLVVGPTFGNSGNCHHSSGLNYTYGLIYTVQSIYDFTHAWHYWCGTMQHHSTCHRTLLHGQRQVCCVAHSKFAHTWCNEWLSATHVYSCINNRLTLQQYVYSTLL